MGDGDDPVPVTSEEGAHDDIVRVLAARDVWKRYGGVTALAGLDFDVFQGEVHSIVGANGAGKSTLMRILVGAEVPDRGTILMNEEPVALRSPRDARERGIAIVHQELSLFPHRTVAANLFVGSEPTRWRLVSRRAMREAAEQALRQVRLGVDLDDRVEVLSLADRQRVEICRALLQQPRILVLDEPNSALNATETDGLFATLRSLQRDGLTIVYVSHRLREVLDISDRVTVVRNGRRVLTGRAKDLTVSTLAEHMLGTWVAWGGR